MPDTAAIAHAHMRSLVSKLGCLDAVVELLNARWGVGHSKGTISRKMAGGCDWGLRDILTLQDALGEYPIWRLGMQQMAEARREAAPCVGALAGAISRETGEAVEALLSADRSARAEDRAQAIKELDDAIAALERARACLRGQVAP